MSKNIKFLDSDVPDISADAAAQVVRDPTAFDRAYAIFRKIIWLYEPRRKEFSGFREGVADAAEGYKSRVYNTARLRLDLGAWSQADIGTGKILDRVIHAIEIQGNNLLYWHGGQGGPAARAHLPLIEAREDTATRGEAERVLYQSFIEEGGRAARVRPDRRGNYHPDGLELGYSRTIKLDHSMGADQSMKRLMVCGLLCGALAACSPSYLPPAEIRPQGDVVISRNYKNGFVTMGQRIGPAIEDGFRPGEEIILGTPSILTGERILYHAGRIKETGANYRFFQDGSGSVRFGDDILKGWGTGCETDKITDERRCSLDSYQAGIIVYYTGLGKPRYACVDAHDFPGRVGALRVDQNQPIRTNVEGCISGRNLHRFLAQMQNGSTTVARAVEWPYDYNRDTTADDTPLFRYAEELLLFLIRNLARLSFSPADATVEELR